MLKYNKLMKTLKNDNSVKSPLDDFCQLSKLHPSDEKSHITYLESFSTSNVNVFCFFNAVTIISNLAFHWLR